MTIERLRSLVHDDFEAVNALILAKITSQIPLIEALAQHLILNGGKRLRPLLVLIASKACGYQGLDHINLAAVIEFFHAATLLHDDVVDESTLRRGKETANEIWGSKASILVGDYLYTQSIQLLVQTKNWSIIQLLSSTSHELTTGEVKQLANRQNHHLSLEDYFDIIKAKTALLFAASASIGALLVSENESIENGLYDYGLHLGIAFQLIDDVLDYSADAKTIGKNIGDDLADGKMTLPLLHALKNGSQSQQTLIKNSLGHKDLSQLKNIQQIIEATNSLSYTRQLAEEEANKAIEAIQFLPESPYKTALIELALYAVQRSY